MVPFIRSKQGFSLVELMTVVFIIGALVAIAIPNFATMQIRAARAEIYVVFRTAQSLVTTYHMEHGKYPAQGLVGVAAMGGGAMPTTVNSYCPPTYTNVIGLQVTNCEKLRYVYAIFSGVVCPRCFIAGDTGGLLYYEITATSLHYTYSSGSWSSTGHQPATWACKSPDPSYSRYFRDIWEVWETNQIRPQSGSADNDATKNCF